MNQNDTDLELLERWRSGDNGAGSALVKRHFAALHRFFSNKASGHDEDLIQQTFVACVEAVDRYRGESSFRAYLYGIARIQLYDHYRKTQRKAELRLVIGSFRDLRTSPSGALCRNEQRTRLVRALEQVPLEQQIALELTYWEGLSAKEVAHVLSIPENTVYSRLRRGKRHLRQALGRQDEAERASTYVRGAAALKGQRRGLKAIRTDPAL